MSLKSSLSEALDDLASSRLSLARRSRALDALERLLAQICAFHDRQDQTELDAFLKLQDGFEFNVASHLVHSILSWTPALQRTANTASTESPTGLEQLSTSRITTQALSILQGIALLHPPSKAFLGKKWCIQVFIDLLLISRHLSTPPLSSSTNTDAPVAPVCSDTYSLASSSIDTLLCILVDFPAAMRAFEDADGVEVVVKTLKRTGVARDIRIKCLEFLYFYLLDETGEVSLGPGAKHQTVPSLPTTARDSTPFPPLATLHTSSPSSPPPRSSPRKARNLAMLRRDVDFVPITPKKPEGSRLGMRAVPPRVPYGELSPTKRGRTSPVDICITQASPSKRSVASDQSPKKPKAGENQQVCRKTTQEKKELLGSLLGNVDSLVESVAKSGIWGLG